jgi:hypothetical protein
VFSAGFHFLTGGLYFSQQAFHHSFRLHSMAVKRPSAVSNPFTPDTSCHVYAWPWMGFGLIIGYIELLQNAATSNSSTVSNSHSASRYRTHLNLLSLLYLHRLSPGNGFQRCAFLSFCVYAFTGRRLSANSVNSRLVLFVTPQHGPHRKHRFQQFYCCGTQMSHRPHREHQFPVSSFVRVKNLLPSNWLCLQSRYLATGLHATVCFILRITGFLDSVHCLVFKKSQKTTFHKLTVSFLRWEVGDTYSVGSARKS